jgi:4-hydroxythreonine-4-phosphate dehydrogenase
MKPLLVSIGDPAGIGPDVILKAYHSRQKHGLAPFIVLGDPDTLASRMQSLGLDTPLINSTPERAEADFAKGLPVWPIPVAKPVKAGQPDPANAPAIIKAIEQGVEAIHQGRGSAIVTAPIAKSVLQSAGFTHPGHTEFLAELGERFWGETRHPVMMIWSPLLAVVPLTIHIPLKEVPEQMTAALLETCVTIIDRDWKTWFGGKQPRMVLAGLNPHAGEDGRIGTEERDVLIPAVKTLQARGYDLKGPFSADTLFHERARAHYDIALCPSHDQALIPVKTLAFDDGVNVTLGLPFIRTSPDHGTAFELAGRGEARPDSMIAALKLADRMRQQKASPQ